MIYQRGNMWWCDVYAVDPATGTKRRKRVSTGCYLGDKTRAELIAAQLKAGVEVHRGEALATLNVSPGATTLSTIFTKLRGTRWASLKAHARVRDSCAVLIRELGDAEIRTVSRSVMVAMVDRMLERGLGDSSINTRLSPLSVALHYAHQEEMIAAVPVIPWRPKSAGRRNGSWLEPDQIRALITAEESPLCRAMWSFMSGTGCRPIEALSIAWADIDTEHRFVTFRDTKNGRDRAVPMSHGLADAMRFLRSSSTGTHPFAVKSEAWWRQKFDGALIRAAIPRIHGTTLYLLRHSAATNWLDAGASIRDVQELLGHSNVQQTVTYAKAKPVALRNVVDRVQQVIDAAERTHAASHALDEVSR